MNIKQGLFIAILIAIGMFVVLLIIYPDIATFVIGMVFFTFFGTLGIIGVICLILTIYEALGEDYV